MNAIIKAIIRFFMNIHSILWYGLLSFALETCIRNLHWSTMLNSAIWGAIHSAVSFYNIKDGRGPKLNKLNLKQVCVQFNSMLDKQNQAFERVSQRKVPIRFSVCWFDDSNSMQSNPMRSSVSSGIQMRKNWYERCLCISTLFLCISVVSVYVYAKSSQVKTRQDIGRLSSSREWLILVRKEKDDFSMIWKRVLKKLSWRRCMFMLALSCWGRRWLFKDTDYYEYDSTSIRIRIRIRFLM